jgi:hypothetical protein
MCFERLNEGGPSPKAVRRELSTVICDVNHASSPCPLESLPNPFTLPSDLASMRSTDASKPRDSHAQIRRWERGPYGRPLMVTNEVERATKRVPNGMVWGETLDDFFRIERFPDSGDSEVVWSRSAVQAFGENYKGQNDWREDEGEPRLMAPWPVLVLRGDEETKQSPADILANSNVGSVIPADAPSDPSGDDGSLVGASSASVAGISDLPESPLTNSNSEHQTSNMPHRQNTEKVNTEEPRTITTTKAKNAKYEDDKVHCKPTGFFSIPKLEEFIPNERFPDTLLVHDAHNIIADRHTHSPISTNTTAAPLRYKRVLPVLPQDFAEDARDDGTSPDDVSAEKVAHLELNPDALLGSGHHSDVYRAALTLPPPLTARSPTGQVRVAAKLAVPNAKALELLEHEAFVYAVMKRYLQETWSGFNLIYYEDTVAYPFRAVAVAPKFYGWYEPESILEERGGDDSEQESEGEEQSVAEGGDVEKQEPTRRPRPSGILLLEECGEPIDPEKLTFGEK